MFYMEIVLRKNMVKERFGNFSNKVFFGWRECLKKSVEIIFEVIVKENLEFNVIVWILLSFFVIFFFYSIYYVLYCKKSIRFSGIIEICYVKVIGS